MFTSHVKPLIQGFEAVLEKIEHLNTHIRTQLIDLPLWIDNNANEFEANKPKLLFALANFGPTEGLSAQETFKCPGVIASTEETLALIQQVNLAKTAFKTAVSQCRQAMDKDVSPFVRKTLTHAGYPCVKLKQVFRHIPFIDYHPRRVSWTKGNLTTSKLLAKHVLDEMLVKAGQGEHIEIQRKKLRNLDHKVKLAKHRNIKPVWIINIGSFKQNNRSNYEDIRAALPLFYLHDQQLPPPIVCFATQRSQTRKTRADKIIDAVPFLPSISVYRYKD